MPAAQNEHCFSQPHWLVIAGGFKTEDWFEKGQGVGTGGILHPHEVDLYTGNYYFRFASSTSRREAQLGGGWWLDFEQFRTIRAFAERHGYSIKDAARLMLALPYAWSRLDRLVRALLIQPMKAYAGVGKPAQGDVAGPDRGTRWVPTQHIKIQQLYIPGLYIQCGRRPGCGCKDICESPRPQLYESVFQHPADISNIT